jgi:hypothetical protein
MFSSEKIDKKAQYFSHFCRSNKFLLPKLDTAKFRYFSATFGLIDSGAAINISPLLGFIFR